MSQNTDNLELTKQDANENFSRSILNANWDKVDAFAGLALGKMFLMGSAQSVSTATNFNNLTDIKNYVITGNAVASASDNCPSSSAGKLCTWTIDGNSFNRAWAYGGQIYVDIVGRVFMRTLSTNGSAEKTFGTWKFINGWIDISSEFTINSTYCEGLAAYTDGHLVYVGMTAKAGTPDQTNLVTNIANAYRPKFSYSNLATFCMNGIDLNKGTCATAMGSTIQLRTNATLEGSSGVKISGCYAI